MPRDTFRGLSIERLPVSSLKLDPRNPRHHSDRQIKQIARSIGSFGFNVPVLIDGNNKVLAGHGRALACQSLGWIEVPVIRLKHLTPTQARAFAIADNRLTETSTWDDRLLGEVLADLSALELEFDLEATGFSMAEIDLRIEGISGERQRDSADEPPEVVSRIPVSTPGDFWILGFTPDGPMNAEGLRAPDECCWHKALDLIGDLALLGRPLLGHVIAERAGHAMHAALVARIMSDATLYEVLTFDQLASRVAQALVP